LKQQPFVFRAREPVTIFENLPHTAAPSSPSKNTDERMPPRVTAVVALTKTSRAIGKAGSLPWGAATLKQDLAFFKRLTSEVSAPGRRNAVIMGRKTWESIPERYRPLAGRLNVVLSRSMSADVPAGVRVVRTLQEALDCAAEAERVFIVGGGEVYREALPVVDDVYVTEVDTEVDACDTFFPGLSAQEFEGPLSTGLPTGEDGGIKYRFSLYVRKPSLKRSFEQAQCSAAAAAARHEEFQYLDLVREVLDSGTVKMDRTGTGTKSVFGRTMRFSLRNGALPLLTTKRTFWRGLALELLWFISGDTSAKTLQDQNVTIWDGNSSREYLDSIGLKHRALLVSVGRGRLTSKPTNTHAHAGEAGDLGPVYGFQWRHFGAEYGTMRDDYAGKGADQLLDLVKQIKQSPDSRRMILTAWNPLALKVCLPRPRADVPRRTWPCRPATCCRSSTWPTAS
jgi:dihydrofolate reductase/thymidylate synthase